VPEEVEFRTKPELAAEMVSHAWQQGVPMRWVTGDEVYGDSTEFRDLIRAKEGCDYVLAVSANTPVWTERPALEPPIEADSRACPPPCREEGALSLTTGAAVVAAWPEPQWQRLTVAEGEKGPRTYDWAYDRVVESRDGLPGPDAWLLARRSLEDPTDIAYYLSSASGDTPLLTLARVASSRYAVEQVIEVRRLLEVALPLPPHSAELCLAWSRWRRARRQQARRSHYRRRGLQWPLQPAHDKPP